MKRSRDEEIKRSRDQEIKRGRDREIERSRRRKTDSVDKTEDDPKGETSREMTNTIGEILRIGDVIIDTEKESTTRRRENKVWIQNLGKGKVKTL